MLYLPAQKLAAVIGVSESMVNRWIQSGWLKGVNSEGKQSIPSTGERGVLVQFDSLPHLIEDRQFQIDLDALREASIELT